MSAPALPNLTVLAHPLIQHKVTLLRDRRTTTRDFKQLVNEIAMLMAYEVTKDLPLEYINRACRGEHHRDRELGGRDGQGWHSRMNGRKSRAGGDKASAKGLL